MSSEVEASRLTVYWVDDQPRQVQKLVKALEGWGHTVKVFPRGDELYEAIEREPALPDLVLVDRILAPDDVDGADLLERLHRAWPDLRLVLSTGKMTELEADLPDRPWLYDVAYSLLPKPTNRAELRWLVGYVTREKALEATFSLDRVGPKAVRQILESMDDEVMVVDLEEGPGQFDVLYTNRARRGTHGDLSGRKCHESLSPGGAPCEKCVCSRAAQSDLGVAATYEHACRRPDGSVYHVSEHASVFSDRRRRFAVNVVRNEEARHQLGLLARRLEAAGSEKELLALAVSGLAAMGYARVRSYAVLELDTRSHLVPVACVPEHETWPGPARDGFTISLDGDRYFARTVESGDSARYTAWELGEPAWAVRVGLSEGDAWVETVVRRFGEPVALLAVDNAGSGRGPVREEDRALLGQLGKTLSQSFELVYGRKERGFLEDLFKDACRCAEPGEAMMSVVRLFKGHLGADACGVFLYDPEAHSLKRVCGLWGERLEERELDFPEEYPLDDPARRGITGHYFLESKEPTILPRVGARDDLRQDYYEQYRALLGADVRSALYLPLVDHGQSIGILRALNRRDATWGQVFDFAEAQRRTADLAQGQITPVLRSLLALEEEKARVRRRSALAVILRVITEERDDRRVMETIVREASTLLSTRSCSVFTVAEPEEKHRLRRDGHLDANGAAGTVLLLRESTEGFFHGRQSDGAPSFYLEGEPEIGVVASMPGVYCRNGVRGESPGRDKYVRAGRAVATDLVGTRLLTRDGELAGVIVLVDKLTAARTPSTSGFTKDDEQLLDALARQAALAIESERRRTAHRETLRRIRALHFLSEVLETERKLEKALGVFLTGLTINDGLGFNRAALFLPDDEKGRLRGFMAVGSLDEEEAHRTWERLAGIEFTYMDAVKEIREHGIEVGSALHQAVKTLAFDVRTDAPELPAAALLDGRSRNVVGPGGVDPVAPALHRLMGTDAFAVAPLKAEGRVLGVVYVDNRFNACPIRPEDVELLELFCGKAAVALVQKRFADLHVAKTYGAVHAIRTPTVALRNCLGTIADAVRDSTLSAELAAEAVQAADVSLTRIELLVSRLNRLSRDTAIALEDCDVFDLVRDAVRFARLRHPDMSIEGPEEGEGWMVRVDREDARGALDELVSNCAKATRERGAASIRVRRDGGRVSVTVADDGPGIEPALRERVFEPWYRGFERGSGLGLFYVRCVVSEMGGSVSVAESASGCSVRLLLPSADRV